MLIFLHDRDNADDGKAVSIPRVFSENSRAKKEGKQEVHGGPGVAHLSLPDCSSKI